MSAARSRRVAGDQRGSVVLMALAFTVILGIATAGFLTACYRSMQFSDRSYNGARSIQFAEMGMEEALWSLKNNNWNGWTLSGGTASRTITGFTYSDGCSGEISIRLQDYNTTSASLVVEGRTVLPDGSSIRKQLVATASQAPVFTNAIFSTYTTTFTEGGTIDSFNSADGSTGGFNAIVAGSSPNPTAGSVIANNADIKGYVAYAGTAPTFGSSGSLRGPSSPANPRIDPSRVVTSPWQQLPNIKPVTGAGALLPAGSFAIGTAGATEPSVYYATDFSMFNGDMIVVNGPVIIGVSGNLYLANDARITVAPTGSLEIRCAGNFYVGGMGIQNQTGDPKKLALLCTSTSTDFNAHVFASYSQFRGILYLPSASLTLRDSIQIFGSVVAREITLIGWHDPQLHYDVALRNSAATLAGLDPVYQLTNWREITDPAELTQF